MRGDNKLQTTAYWGNSPGLWAPESNGSELIIENGETGNIGSLFTSGAAAWSGIGIANTTGEGSRITIKSGKITAFGGVGAAGIGSAWGSGGYNGTITIEGGDVIATGGDNGAGIGSGKADSGNNNYKGSVIITGGYVVATGGTNGAGIGGGYGSTFGDITIVGGYVRAIGVYQAPNIGGGMGSNARLNTQNLIIGSEVILADGTESSLHYQNGLVFDNTGQATVKGNAELPVDMTIGQGKTLTIPSETSLTVKEGVTLTNEGTMDIVGTLTNNGTIIQRSEDEIEGNNGSIIQQTALTAEMIQLPSTSFIYNGHEHQPQVTITNSTQRFTTHYTNNINAGTASVTVTMEPTTNANDFYGEATVTFEIQQAEPSPNLFSASFPSSLTYDGTSKSVSAIYNGTQSSDGISIVYYNSSNEVLQSAPTDAGRYTFAIDLSGNHNFVSTNPIHDDNWQFEINQANPVFDDWNVQGRSYNGSAIENVTVPVLRGVTDEALSGVTLSYYYKQGDVEELTTPSNSGSEQDGGAPVWAGSYIAKARFEGDQNYSSIETTANFTITKAIPYFSSIEMPQSFVYDGLSKEINVRVTGVVEGEQFPANISYEKQNAEETYETITEQPTDMGTYRALASFENRNYQLIQMTIPFRIAAVSATLTFAHSSLTITQGNAVPTNVLTKPEDCAVSYTSSNPAVATVNETTGAVTVVGTGKTIIMATAMGNYASSAFYTLTVNRYIPPYNPPSIDPEPTYYTVKIPESLTGAILTGGGTFRIKEGEYVSFRIELDPSGAKAYPIVRTGSWGNKLTPDSKGNYQFRVSGNMEVIISEVPADSYDYYQLSLPTDSVVEKDNEYWSAAYIEVVGAKKLRAAAIDRFMAPFGATVTLRPIETERRKFLQWEDGSKQKERTLTLRADQEIKALWQRISPTGIEAIAAGSVIRGERGQLYIEVPEPCDVTLYTYGGVPVRVARLAAGANHLANLNAGLYLVKLGGAQAVPIRIR